MGYLFFVVCIFSLDLFIKKQIEAQDEAVFPIRLKGGFVLEKHHNYGFMLNRFDRHPKLVRALCALTTFPILIWYSYLTISHTEKRAGGVGRIGAACLIGGAASNLYDRLFRGYVVDYLRLPIKKIHHIIFNIADFFIFIGAALAAIHALFSD